MLEGQGPQPPQKNLKSNRHHCSHRRQRHKDVVDKNPFHLSGGPDQLQVPIWPRNKLLPEAHQSPFPSWCSDHLHLTYCHRSPSFRPASRDPEPDTLTSLPIRGTPQFTAAKVKLGFASQFLAQLIVCFLLLNEPKNETPFVSWARTLAWQRFFDAVGLSLLRVLLLWYSELGCPA